MYSIIIIFLIKVSFRNVIRKKNVEVTVAATASCLKGRL